MIKGFVINNCGRGKHIFKQSVGPGMKVPLDKLYSLYAKQYGGDFDINFLEWLEKTKVPKNSGFDIIINDIGQESIPEKKETVVYNTVPSKLTARQIASLKIKDKPRKVLQEIMSIHKLRRALTLCKNRPGKETLYRLIKVRLTELT